ncbi:MAG TPA: hypothetical protein VGO61_08300 [Steroidobacteraceae bacterium]|nr:hypothetical protein [Steroidobacteraceae bacterium]
MRLISAAFCAGMIAASFASIPRADATTVKHFDLGHMTASAGRVFRGTVTDVRPGSVKVGGGQLATTIYRIRVTETFKGEFATFKNITYADVEMIGSLKAESEGNGIRHFSLFRDMPRLERGRDYLLFLTAESSIALSSPVGLAQGLFDIDTSIPSQPTANRLNNAGLAADVEKGPLAYSDLAARVRTIIATQGEKR